VGFKVKVEVKN